MNDRYCFSLSMNVLRKYVFVLATLSVAATAALADEVVKEDGWISLFNGDNLDGWRVSDAAAQSWSVVDGVIDCDPKTTASGERDIWSEESFGDFVLYVEWRLTDTPTVETWPKIGPDGGNVVGEDGEVVTETFPNADSGIYLRGMPKAQVNIWNWPIGSGEVWGYRTDGSMSAEVRAGVTPRVRADKEPGQWNRYVITMIGDRLSVLLNGEVVLNHAQLPGVDERGPIGLQYHGGFDHEKGEYLPASSLVQFRNLFVKPLD